MPVKLRLQRKGRSKRPFYHIVAADARAPRDGRFIEKIGTYNPLTKPATIEIDRDRAFFWVSNGAQPTDTVHAILRFKGVMFKKHLMRGVQKGAFSEEVALKKHEEWVDMKEAKIAARFEETINEKSEFRKHVFGKIPAVTFKQVEAPAVVVEPTVEAVAQVEAHDLTKIEGIGPKINELLQNAGINTFEQLASTSAERVKEILEAAGGNFASHDPSTWAQQATLAANGDWDALKSLQDELQGGRVVAQDDTSTEG